MRQLTSTCIAALVLAAGWALQANAASTLSFRAIAVQGKRAPTGRIYAGGSPVMTIGGYGWKSVETAREVAQRLNALADEGLRPDEISFWSDRKTRTIMARGERIITIDKKTAASQGVDRTGLARSWVSNLRAQFAQPYLSVTPLLVPVGETRAMRVRGNIAGELTARPEAAIVTATWSKATKEISVAGVDTGRTDLIIEDSANAIRVPVRSAKYAARLVESLPAEVTGNPASADVIDRAVRAAIGAGMIIEAGATTEIRAAGKDTGPIWPGKSAAVPAGISAAGPSYLPYHLEPTVTVRNEPVTPGPATFLLVSNSPERILTEGLWFEGKILDSETVRFLYHHVNGMKTAADLVVELWNVGPEAARVQVIGGTAGPSYDEAYVGHRAATEFLANRVVNSGWIVPVPAGTTVPVITQRMRPGSVASGILEFRALGAANLSLRLYLEPPASERTPRDIATYVASPLLGQWHYTQTVREVKARYEVGRDWAFVTIGDQPARGIVDGDVLEGSYGVLYTIDLELVNPTSQTARVAVMLESAGGPARGALLVDGHQVGTALLRRDSEGLVARYSLAPGQSRTVHIETMPQGGSNYPVRLVARPI